MPISYGLDNAYHHPAGETFLQRLFDVGATVYGTERAAPSSSPPTAGHTASTPPRRSPHRGRGCLRRFRRIDVSLKRWYHVFNKPCLAGFECLQGTVILTEKSGSAHYDAAKRGSAASLSRSVPGSLLSDTFRSTARRGLAAFDKCFCRIWKIYKKNSCHLRNWVL